MKTKDASQQTTSLTKDPGTRIGCSFFSHSHKSPVVLAAFLLIVANDNNTRDMP